MSEELEQRTGEPEPRKRLQPAKELAAQLDALGWPSTRISAALEDAGMKRSAGTIKNWRMTEDYRAAVAEYIKGVDVVSAIKTHLSKTLNLSGDALDTLHEQLDAADNDGNAMYGVRGDAAHELLSHGRGLLQAIKKEEGKSVEVNAVVNVVLPDWKPPQPVAEEIEIEDGEIEESDG